MLEDLHQTVTQRLIDRDESTQPICATIDEYAILLEKFNTLQTNAQTAQKNADLAHKEKAEMQADLNLLRENEQNQGVSKTHIEVLQEQLEKSKSECMRMATELADARKRADASEEVAAGLSENLASLREELHIARECASRNEGRARREMERAIKLQEENTLLIQRCTAQLQMQADVMDSEIEEHGSRVRSTSEAVAAAAAASERL